ncbi:hypothetical protein HR11_09465 [Porphyromonas macacae]|nr:hypothetical protein HR11_09465 [Porphyromonas macacae]
MRKLQVRRVLSFWEETPVGLVRKRRLTIVVVQMQPLATRGLQIIVSVKIDLNLLLIIKKEII